VSDIRKRRYPETDPRTTIFRSTTAPPIEAIQSTTSSQMRQDCPRGVTCGNGRARVLHSLLGAVSSRIRQVSATVLKGEMNETGNHQTLTKPREQFRDSRITICCEAIRPRHDANPRASLPHRPQFVTAQGSESSHSQSQVMLKSANRLQEGQEWADTRACVMSAAELTFGAPKSISL
jgi:hypothetical protein